MTEQKKDITQFVDRKNASIAFFNATNAAVSVVSTTLFPQNEDKMKAIRYIRDELLADYNEYARYVLDAMTRPVAESDIAGAINRMKKCKTTEELRGAWLRMPESVRSDKKVLKELKVCKKSIGVVGTINVD